MPIIHKALVKKKSYAKGNGSLNLDVVSVPLDYHFLVTGPFPACVKSL